MADIVAGSEVRQAIQSDLESINRVIESAIMGWDLAERVKRLSLPLYRYTAFDFEYMTIHVAEITGKGIVGLCAVDAANPADAPQGKHALLLHGLYVLPEMQRRGYGSHLLQVAIGSLEPGVHDGLLVKAYADAGHFFQSRGMQQLAPDRNSSAYDYHYWLETG